MKTMNAEKMMTSVLTELGISGSNITGLSIAKEDGYYHVTFSTDLMEYEVYADAETGVIAGLNTMPVPEERLVAEAIRPAFAA